MVPSCGIAIRRVGARPAPRHCVVCCSGACDLSCLEPVDVRAHEHIERAVQAPVQVFRRRYKALLVSDHLQVGAGRPSLAGVHLLARPAVFVRVGTGGHDDVVGERRQAPAKDEVQRVRTRDGDGRLPFSLLRLPLLARHPLDRLLEGLARVTHPRLTRPRDRRLVAQGLVETPEFRERIRACAWGVVARLGDGKRDLRVLVKMDRATFNVEAVL